MKTINLLAALIVFNLIIIIYQIVVEVFSAIFSIEGIQLDKAKFQIISILTGTGFTTAESELMLSTKRRRKLTQTMILFSYIFNVTILSTIVNIFISTANTSFVEVAIGVILTIINFTILVIFNKSGKIRSNVDRRVKLLAMQFRKRKGNSISIYDVYGEKCVVEVNLRGLNRKIQDKTAKDLDKEYNIQILVIKRGEELFSNIEEMEIKRNDILIVFGNLKNIKKLFGLNRVASKKKIK